MNYRNLFLLAIIVTFTSCDTVAEKTEIDMIQERGVLIVGSDIPYGIMEYYDDSGNPAGVDVDLAKDIAQHLGVDLEFRDVAWDDLFTALDNEEIDLAISSITVTEERRERMLFSEPYFVGGQSLVAGPNYQSMELTNPETLKVGVQSGTTGEAEAKKIFSDEFIFSYSTIDVTNYDEGIVYDLLTGKIDLVMMDEVVALQLALARSDELRVLDEEFSPENYGVAAKLGHDLLIQEVNEVVESFIQE